MLVRWWSISAVGLAMGACVGFLSRIGNGVISPCYRGYAVRITERLQYQLW